MPSPMASAACAWRPSSRGAHWLKVGRSSARVTAWTAANGPRRAGWPMCEPDAVVDERRLFVRRNNARRRIMTRSLTSLLVVLVACLCHTLVTVQEAPPRFQLAPKPRGDWLADSGAMLNLGRWGDSRERGSRRIDYSKAALVFHQQPSRVDPWRLGVPQLPHLVGHYRFDDGAKDETGYHHGTVKGAKVVDSERGRAMSFDGHDDHVRVSHSQRLDITNCLTMAAWVKLSPKTRANRNGENGQAYLITKGRLTGRGVYRLLAHTAHCPWSPKSFNFNVKTSDGEPNGHWVAATPESGNAFDDTWHHVAGTFDGRSLELYIDGVQKAETPIDGIVKIVSRRCDVAIGGWGPSGFRMMRGLVDDVWIYNTALNLNEIRVIGGFATIYPEFVLPHDPPCHGGQGARGEHHSAAMPPWIPWRGASYSRSVRWPAPAWVRPPA